MTTDATPAALRLIDQLGPLPDCYSRYKHEVGMPLYSADQMRAYAAQEVAAERERWRAALERVTDALARRLGTNADEWPDVRTARKLLEA